MNKALSPIYEMADSFAMTTSRSFFLTGKAGTGKTTFLKNLRLHTRKQIAVVAPTGVAAINAGGMTIHSFFQLPFTPFVPTPEGRLNLVKKLHVTRRKRKVMQELELLVIDEVSMVRADIMDEIDTVLRHVRFRHHEPFGGVQVILIGDLYQMAPVALPEEWAVIAPYYRSPYFFDSCVIRENPMPCMELDTIFRQKDDEFIRILNDVRNNQLTATDLEALQRQYKPDFNIAKHPDYILLTTHNYKADRVNESELARIRRPERVFTADITGDFPERNLPNAMQLKLKKGARVMFVANDVEQHRYFNGKLGEVTDIDDEGRIFVRCDDEYDEIEVKPETWKNVRYSVDPATRQIQEEEMGSFRQFPLRPAWAITIHKSQGLTFDKVAVDVEAAFTAGQVYVALSRCRTLQGIALLSNVNQRSLGVDGDVLAYASQKATSDDLRHLLEDDRREYNHKVVTDIFDFSFSHGQSHQLVQFVGDEANLFNAKARNSIQPIREAIDQLTEVSHRCRRQLDKLYDCEDQERLKERIKAASQYFTDELDKIIKLFKSLPSAATDDYESAEEFRFCLESLYEDLMRKRYVIRNIRRDFSTDHVQKLQREVEVPRLDIKPYRSQRQSARKSRKSLKEEIMDEVLETMRKRRKRDMVVSKKRSKSDDEEGRTETPVKRVRGETYEITYRMYCSGKSLEKIAEERGLTLSTIETHLARLIGQGRVSVFDFVTQEQLDAVRESLEAGLALKDIFEALEGNVSYGQLRMMQAAVKKESELD